MGGVVLGLIAFFIFLTTRIGTPKMALLYGDLESKDSSQIVSQLEGMGIPYELKRNGTQILVPGDRALRLRLSMAEQGLPSGGSIGYEIFDKSDSLGTTNFMQNVNLVRALEGELARTISSLNSVQRARVHLVMPRRELFSREKQKPSASVILTMRGGRLEKEVVSSIQHLVAAAVPSLTPSAISIIDNKGSLLARGFEDANDVSIQAARADERRRDYENRMAGTIEDLLARSLGYGKVRAHVSAEMDFDRVNSTEENYDPDGQVVRSTLSVEESSSSRESDPNESVSVANNMPDPAGGNADAAGNSAAETRTEETVNFEISKKIVNHVRESGVIKRLSVAVLVDGVYTGTNETRTYAERPVKEMDLLAILVRSAIGFNLERGDSVEVVNMRFAEPETAPEEELKLFFGFNKNDVLRMAEILVLSIVAVLVILLVVRPLLARAFEALPSGLAAATPEARLLAGEAGEAPALTGPDGRPLSEEGAQGNQERFDELIDIDRVEGRVKASSVNKVGEIVSKHPEEALSIIRSWMYQGT